MIRRIAGLVVAAAVLALAPAASAADKDYSATARNVIPSGQWGGLGVPSGVDPAEQAKLYDGLTPLFDKVTNADLNTYFKSERFGIDTDGPATVEPVPYPGVTITRDRFHVPHVDSDTYAGGVWAAGWIVAEDRGLLIQQARFNARVAAIDAPGLSAIGLTTGLKTFVPSQATEDVVARQSQVLAKQGKEGKAVLRDIDTFISGINAYLQTTGSTVAPWTRNDIFALNALKGQFLGQGGGDEARRSEFLAGLKQRLGAKKGLSVFGDLAQHKNAELPASIDGKFPYQGVPKNTSGSVIIDAGSYVRTPAAVVSRNIAAQAESTIQASNTLMIDSDHSATGKPLMVGGPQIGYNYPGLTYEIDMHAPGLVWRGATSAPFPGYMLIGRAQDFATTLTSASADIIDQYAETLCGGSDHKYMYKGTCRDMEFFDAGVLKGSPDQEVTFYKTVHGPVTGYATVKGKKVAIASKRSSYGRDSLDLLFNRRISNGSVHNYKQFFDAAAKTPQTFNSFYIDSRHIAVYTAGQLPVRSDKVDPRLLTKGTGQYEWQGYLGQKGHPQGIDPKNGRIVNWNQSVARGFGAADDQWGRNGSVERVDLLNKNLDRLKKKGKWSLAAVTSAMNAGATQDVRAIDTVPLLARLLKGTTAPTPQAQQMLNLMQAWKANGGSRLDLDLDGKIDDPGAAVMDGSWDGIADATMGPVLGPMLDAQGNQPGLSTFMSRFDLPPGGQYNGWYQYFDRDIRSLLGEKNKQPLANSYCGKGKKGACQKAVWAAIADAGTALTASQGTSDPSLWRSDATRERIKFTPLSPAGYTMRYTNRPSGIQQVVSFKGHR